MITICRIAVYCNFWVLLQNLQKLKKLNKKKLNKSTLKCCLSFVKNKSNLSHISSAFTLLLSFLCLRPVVSSQCSCPISSIYYNSLHIQLPFLNTHVDTTRCICLQTHVCITKSYTPHSYIYTVYTPREPAAQIQYFSLLQCHMGHVIILHIHSSSANPICTLHHSNC